MKDLKEIFVSVYENVYSKTPKKTSFLEVMHDCIRPTHMQAIRSIRGYYADGQVEAAQMLKKRLPCFTPAGTFDGAHAIRLFRTPSNLVGLDYDHVPNREELLRICAEDPHTVAALESPTDGLKVFAYVEGMEGRYREGQELVARHYDRLLGLESDPACKDESRLCYFTYSPNGYLGTLFECFRLEEPQTPAAAPVRVSTEAAPPPFEADAETCEKDVEKFLLSYIFLNPLTVGKRHTNLFKLACEACRRGYSQQGVLRGLTTHFKDSNYPFSELKSVVESGYKTVTESTTPTGTTGNSGVQSDKRTKMTLSTPEKEDEWDERYWEGEEFRKNTPCFPNELYENLPALLNDCVVEEVSRRERDISLLSDITALSAVLPNTFGIYNHKRYSPHIYSVIISPAGSGKSIAQTGRYLLDEVHERILAGSEQALKVYQSEYATWQAQNKSKTKTKETPAEEPVMPPFKMLIIPATTSYTRMQMQMRDNDRQGSIIFDTEAQTLSTANQLDCGNFDDMLRKAFEHEHIDSSYKANGLKPISIRRPQLALLLTGTPGQLNTLLTSSENGLASRILYYTYREAPNWKEMGDDAESLEDRFAPLAHRVADLYNFCRNQPVCFHFKLNQWAQLNRTFSQLLRDTALENNDDLQGVVKRYAFLVMRISMIQTRIRQFETGNLSPDIYCDDRDFQRSLHMVLCCYEHSRLLLASITSDTLIPLKNPDKKRRFFDELPTSFSTEDAHAIGAKYDMGTRMISRLLKSLNGVKIKKIAHGQYEKLE